MNYKQFSFDIFFLTVAAKRIQGRENMEDHIPTIPDERIWDMIKTYRSEMVTFYHYHQQNFQIYLAFVTTVLGVSIAGFLNVKSYGWTERIILFGPLMNIFIGLIAMKTCDVYWRRILDTLYVVTKLGQKLELDKLDVLPKKWKDIASEIRKLEDQDAFFDKFFKVGANRLARYSFAVIIAANVLLIILIELLNVK